MASRLREEDETFLKSVTSCFDVRNITTFQLHRRLIVAGDYVVGVWVGNDDNSPLDGVHGGSTPARIWRDFMQQALGERAAPPSPQHNPEGPVQPLDVDGLDKIPEGPLPLGGNSNLRIENGTAIITTDLNGVPLDVRLDSNGVNVDGGKALQEAQKQIQQGLNQAQAQVRSQLQPSPTPSGTASANPGN